MEIETLGHYRIVEQIGEGGMGVVYKARDTHLDRFVALKVIRGEGFTDPARQQRFVTEARAASALTHPNILTIHDVSQDQGVVFIVMEYVDGRTLSEAIGRKGLRVGEAIRIAIQIAAALERAHAAGIVHRDLKPGNIMIAKDGVVKVLDFGLAKLLQPQATGPESTTLAAPPVTADGVILGTVAYMSPEQATGSPVDARSDIFAFGAVLYEMLTGAPAFARDSQVLTLTAVLRDMPVPVHERVDGVPEELERVITMCLQKDPARRFQHVADVRVLLERMKEDTESSPRAPSSVTAVPVRGFGRRTLMLAAAVLVVLIGLAASLFWYTRRSTAQVGELAQTGFTFDDGLTFQPALSPDGSLAAYASDRSGEGHLDIYVQQASGARAIRLTQNPADDSQPAFSPDGSKIVFRSERDGGGIYIVDALGGTERKLASRGFFPRYSPDGRRIAFIDVPAAGLSSTGAGLFVVSADGGAPVALQPDLIVSQLPGLAWSPDGKYVLVQGRERTARGGFFAVPLEGGRAIATELSASAPRQEGAAYYPCAWTADGIIYSVSGSVEGSRLLLAPPPGPDLRITGQHTLLLSTSHMLYGAVASNEGELLYGLLDWTPNYWMVGLDSRQGHTHGAPTKITSDTTLKLDAAMSRDGSHVAYVRLSSRRDQKSDLRIRSLRDGRETSIPLSGRFRGNFTLRLSADASFVTFHDWDGRKWMTYLMRTDGSAKTVLCDDCAMLQFGSQPRIAYVFKADTVMRHDSDRNADTRLLDLPIERLSDAAVSADDRWIAVVLENADRTADIAVASLSRLPITERDLTIVAHDARHLASPRWSADGTLLYYLSQRDGFVCIWAQRLHPRTRTAAGQPFPVLHQHEARLSRFGPKNIFSLEVAANALLLNLMETRGNVWTANLRDRTRRSE